MLFFSNIQHLQHVRICLWTILPYLILFHNCPSPMLPKEKVGCNPPGKQNKTKKNKGQEGHSKYIISIKKVNKFSSVTQSCPTFCNPMNCSTPGFPVHNQLLELTQTHVDGVSDAIQPSHPAFHLSQHQGLFQCVEKTFPSGGQSIGVLALAFSFSTDFL